MPHVSSGKRYAQAVFELALERGELESCQVGLSKVTNIIVNETIMGLLENPKLPFGTKKMLMEEGLGKVNTLILNLACLLMSRGKLRIIGEISQHYGRLLDTHHGIEHAELITAVSLDDKAKKRLSMQFAKMVGHKVVIDARVDPSIIGGVRAKINDTLIDGSIHNMLETLKKSLIEAEC